jgi:hypothetical protein
MSWWGSFAPLNSGYFATVSRPAPAAPDQKATVAAWSARGTSMTMA